jgi:Flp pilus assembly protein TadG
MTKLLRKDEAGAASIEMALSLPILVVLIYGIFQVGLLFQANAGMQHALGEGARYASLCIPNGSACNVPTNDNIKAKMNATLFGKSDGSFNVQDVGPGVGYRTLTITYSRTMSFLLFPGPTVTLTRTKKVYTAGV